MNYAQSPQNLIADWLKNSIPTSTNNTQRRSGLLPAGTCSTAGLSNRLLLVLANVSSQHLGESSAADVHSIKSRRPLRSRRAD